MKSIKEAILNCKERVIQDKTLNRIILYQQVWFTMTITVISHSSRIYKLDYFMEKGVKIYR